MKIRETLFEKRYDGERYSIPISDIPKELIKDENDIKIEIDPGYYSDNNSWDPFTTLEIIHYREETEEEAAITKFKIQERLKESKQERHAQYLRLKKEFEL